jgi:hypothetical protein
MPQSLVRNLIHLTFSTKERRRLIADDIRAELNKYLAGILRMLRQPDEAGVNSAAAAHMANRALLRGKVVRAGK